MENLTGEHIRDVCGPGRQEQCCRYLMLGPEGWRCAHDKGERWVAFFDLRVANGEMVAQGQNCAGRAGTCEVEEWNRAMKEENGG